MNKILVEVFLPASGRRYDVQIPCNTKIHEVLPLLTGLLGEISNGYYIPMGDAAICSLDTGVVLDLNKTAREHGLQNGAKLMVI